MAKLHFNYSVMNAGKSTHLLSARHNYIDNGSNVMTFTSSLDNRSGVGIVSSRIGIHAEAVAISDGDSIYDIVSAAHHRNPVQAVLVDEVQFMTAHQVVEMSDIVDFLSIPVMAYGLKNNAQGKLFGPSIIELLALANECNEIKQVCHCGSKATMILKYNKKGVAVRDGEIVEIGDESQYVSVCRKHWKSGDIGPRARSKILESGEEIPVVCQTCKGEFPMIFDDHEQGSGCASILSRREINGHYGSSVADMTTFQLPNGAPAGFKEGVICDSCIKKCLHVIGQVA